MARLIDAEHFKAWILARWEENNPCSEYPLTGKEIIDQIDREKEYPIIDAVPVIRCKDCIYYDEPHVEKDGKRFRYEDMPKEAFDILGVGVTSYYGINVGGRCCRDDNAGYMDDKRIFVSETNFCGRAVRKKE